MVIGNPHVPVSIVVDGVVECRVCGRRVYGYPGHLRHEGEDRPFTPIEGDPALVARARDVAHRAAADVGPLSDEADLVDAVVAALARQGLLRKRPARAALAATG
jgi:hypothetical protein